jgi:hypothetical protein
MLTKVGNEFDLKNLQSFSLNKARAADFDGGPRGLVLSVRTKRGIDIMKLSRLPHEKELLLDKGGLYRIISVTKKHIPGTGECNWVTLEEIGL